MKYLKKTQFSPIGLDLASTAVRGVQLWRRGETVGVHSGLEVKFDPLLFHDKATEALPPLMYADTNPGNADEKKPGDDVPLPQANEILRDSIMRLMHLGGFRGREVMIHCPVDYLDMRPVSLPSGPEGLSRDTILGVLRHQLSDHISFAIDQAVIDYSVLEYNGRAKQLEVMAFVADGGWIEKQILLLRSLKLNCVGVDPIPFTLSRLASGLFQQQACDLETTNRTGVPVETNVDEELIALLDIGYTGTTLVVMRGRNPVFCRRFSLGGREMTQLLSRHLMIDPIQAERLKVTFGLFCHAEALPGTSSSHHSEESLHIAKTIFTALQSKLDEFIEGVIRSLNYVISQQRNARMTRLLLSGRVSHTRHLSSYLAEKLGIPVKHISQPMLSDILQALPASRATSGSWGIATGLAMTAFTDTLHRFSSKNSDSASTQQKVATELLEVG